MPKIDKMIVDLISAYDLDANQAVWDCHGTWVMYHRFCERIAAKAGIEFALPQIVHHDLDKKRVVVLVEGSMPVDAGERKEWSFGEVDPSNNKNAYPFAMAEKRAKDRVILKLAGLAGFVYSEEEADDFKPNAQAQQGASQAPPRDFQEPDPVASRGRS